jgi:nicotinate-nucleotide pyrophosphorylase (carboxylating)
MKLKKEYYSKLIKSALLEDLRHTGDVTSKPLFKNEVGIFKLLSKDTGILCGKEIFIEVFRQIDKKCKVTFYFNDTDRLNKMDIVARVEGKILSILKAERTALNIISHLSGIATKVNSFVQAAEGKIKILDTRKTIPGLRMLQKYAVFCGGGTNHRIGLYDMVLIKDNHIDASGSITNAVNKIRKKWKNKYKIETETRNLKEVEEALSCNVDRIMLDNMNDKLILEAVKLINKRTEVEISGNVTLERIKTLKETGADYVSIGELTHTIRAFDFSLKKEE